MPCISLCSLQMNQHDLTIFLQSSEVRCEWCCSVLFSWLSKASCFFQEWITSIFWPLKLVQHNNLCNNCLSHLTSFLGCEKVVFFSIPATCGCECVYMCKGGYKHQILPPACLNYFALDLLHVMNLLYNLLKDPKIAGMKELDRLLSTVYDPCSGYRFDWKRFYSLHRVLQYHPLRVLVTNSSCPPALPCSAWHRPPCLGGTSGYRSQVFSDMLKFFFFLERKMCSAKCEPTALSNTQPEAWGSPRFGHKW